MSWLANFSAWINGTTQPQVADFQNITSDIHTWGGAVDAGAYGLADSAYVVLNPGSLPGTTYTVTAATWAGSVGTYTIGTHTLLANQLVTISGATPAGWNIAQASIISVTATQITLSLTSNPGAWVSGGTAQAGGVNAANGMLAINSAGAIYTYYGGSWVAALGAITSLSVIGTYNGVSTAGNGMPIIVGTLGLTGQTANIASTNLLASVPSNGWYEVSVYEVTSTAASSTSTMPAVHIGYTDKDSGQVIAGIAVTSTAANVLGTVSRGSVDCFMAASTAITYSTTGYASSGGTSLAYGLHIRVRFLG